jgi:hypothetical protein
MPAYYKPGTNMPVVLRSEPPIGAPEYRIEERPPAGWAVGVIAGGGVYDALAGKIAWGPFPDAQPRTLLYEIRPPAGATGPAWFDGVVLLGAEARPVGGMSAIYPLPPSPPPRP